MTNFDEILDAAEAEPAETSTVRVCVNPTVAKKRHALLVQLDQAKKEDAAANAAASTERLTVVPEPATERTDAAVKALEAFDDEVLKSLVTLKFTRLDARIWSALTDASPMRVDVPLDRNYGYNFDAVSEAAARRSGVRLDDDGEHELTEQQWDRLFKVLSGHDRGQIRDIVWTLNEYAPQQHVEALVKGFGAA